MNKKRTSECSALPIRRSLTPARSGGGKVKENKRHATLFYPNFEETFWRHLCHCPPPFCFCRFWLNQNKDNFPLILCFWHHVVMFKLPDWGSTVEWPKVNAKYCVHCKSLNLEPRFRDLVMYEPQAIRFLSIRSRKQIECASLIGDYVSETCLLLSNGVDIGVKTSFIPVLDRLFGIGYNIYTAVGPLLP